MATKNSPAAAERKKAMTDYERLLEKVERVREMTDTDA